MSVIMVSLQFSVSEKLQNIHNCICPEGERNDSDLRALVGKTNFFCYLDQNFLSEFSTIIHAFWGIWFFIDSFISRTPVRYSHVITSSIVTKSHQMREGGSLCFSLGRIRISKYTQNSTILTLYIMLLALLGRHFSYSYIMQIIV